MNVQRHEIRKLNPLSDEYTLFIYLDDHLSEFAAELGTEPSSNKNLQATAKQILKERYPGLKVTMIKVILGGMAVTSISLSTTDSNAVQAANTPANAAQTDGNSITTYTVAAGDTVYGISKRYGTTPEALRSANHLTSDFLQIGQVLTIPSVGAKFYTVAAGDTLYSISNRFGTTVASLRSANNLTSDILSIGQSLTIPAAMASPSQPAAPIPAQYTVVAGDTLYSISNRFGPTVSAVRSANHLTSDILSIGQTLTIPAAVDSPPQPPAPAPLVKEERKTFTYAVKSGDSLSVIAKRFGVSVDSIRAVNQLSSDFLQVGQALTIPDGLNAPTHAGTNTITYTTHTIASGENIWDLSVRYGVPQAELLKANNLTTSSMLSVGQVLKIPVHNIGVKEVVSERHGEDMDWWTEAQYIFTIGKTAKVTDFETGRSFYIKRTIGANHADSETVTTNDSNMAKSIWGGFSWTPRAVILDIDGRKIAASMSFMPHERKYILLTMALQDILMFILETALAMSMEKQMQNTKRRLKKPLESVKQVVF
ncbi:LysM peptidoglycan-binding domain-containing protein [Neobacillus sp. NPDC093182]|uniref:LysM peptidoglycan-binding domain-containing protein n=1 Tax=Neobacillus sp. NPDC093182 TaxID=3364297 RepID=UPI00382E2A06